MLGFIILFILLRGSTQKSTPLGVVHIMAVNGPFVQNDQVVQKTLLLVDLYAPLTSVHFYQGH